MSIENWSINSKKLTTLFLSLRGKHRGLNKPVRLVEDMPLMPFPVSTV